MQRERLTITLRNDILAQVDRVIDGTKIRNRSHAIEYLIQQASTPTVSKALILAGGKGIKSTLLSKELPKALLDLDGKPVLQYMIENCRDSGIGDIYISIGPEGKAVSDYFGDGSKFGIRITYLKQTKSDTGTAPSLLQAKKAMNGGPFLLLFGDVVSDINLNDFIDYHLSNNNFATMALTSVGKTADWGVVHLHGTIIKQFIEKPKEGSVHSYVINAGMYIFEPEVFDYISTRSKKLEQDLFPKLAEEGKLFGYLFDGRWFDVGASSMYHQALKEFSRK